MFREQDPAIRRLENLVSDLTREFSASKEQIAALQIQVSELSDKVKEIEDKQERQEREDEHSLPSGLSEELHERNMN